MIFEDVKKAVDHFSPDELRKLREYIEDREQQLTLHAGTVNLHTLSSALDEIRAGLSDAEFAEIEQAINEE